MRFYDIKITDSSGSSIQEYTSFKGGVTLPGALNVEYNLPVVPFATPYGHAFIRVWGIPIAQISQASDLNGKTIEVSGGFKKGLPLANPAQAGVILRGYIFQAYGNWIGTDMTLDLDVVGGPTPDQFGKLPKEPPNITLNWKKGTKLSDAITSTLQTAYPGMKVKINISQNLVLGQDDPGFFTNLEQFGQHIKEISASIIGGDYPGVDFFIDANNEFDVYDGTTKTNPLNIDFKELIGQPTWIDAPTIQFKTPMRADLSVNDYVKLPPGLQTTQPGNSLAQSKLKTAFQGSFQIIAVVHFGNFRQPDAASWVSVFNAVPSSGVNAS